MSRYTSSNFVEFPGLIDLLEGFLGKGNVITNVRRPNTTRTPSIKPVLRRPEFGHTWFRSEDEVANRASEPDKDVEENDGTVTINKPNDDDEEKYIISSKPDAGVVLNEKPTSLFVDDRPDKEIVKDEIPPKVEPIDDGKPDGNLGKNSFYLGNVDEWNAGAKIGDEVKPMTWEEFLNGFGVPRKMGEEPDVKEDPIDEEDDDLGVEPDEPKDPFVFIANRLTFLIKSRYPIIWRTSRIVKTGNDKLFVALDDKENPQIDIRTAVRIANEVNNDSEIQKEISEYLDGTEWKDIYCMPLYRDVNGVTRFGFEFSVTK